MEESKLRPGELVVYVDPDQIQWGPWEVIQVCCDEAIPLIASLMEYPIPCSRLL